MTFAAALLAAASFSAQAQSLCGSVRRTPVARAFEFPPCPQGGDCLFAIVDAPLVRGVQLDFSDGTRKRIAIVPPIAALSTDQGCYIDSDALHVDRSDLERTVRVTVLFYPLAQ